MVVMWDTSELYTPRMDMRDVFEKELGFVPGALAVMGKWEPAAGPRRCLPEVAARAAAALALSEALEPDGPGPYLLAAEGLLRGQPRPGCILAASILCSLGGRPERIRVWPAANRTALEIYSLDIMRRRLGGGGLLLITSGYHVPRTRWLLEMEIPGVREVVVRGIGSPLVRQALHLLPSPRRAELERVIAAGTRRGLARIPVAITEGIGFLLGRYPGLEQLISDAMRGRVRPVERQMFLPI